MRAAVLIRSFAGLWLVLVAATIAAMQSPVDKLFKEGNALLENKRYAAALKKYKQALILAPDEEALMWNAGMAAQFSGDYPTAIRLYKQLKKIDPQNHLVRPKLIQTYQASGAKTLRDAERKELINLWRRESKTNPTSAFGKKTDFCRDQFTAAGRSVFAYETYEMKGDRAQRYRFLVLKEDGREDFRITLGSYPLTNDFAQQRGELKKGERLFHLDGYFKGGLHKTYGFYNGEPSYENIRASVVKIVKTNSPGISSSKRGTTGI